MAGMNDITNLSTAVLGGGCFWCLEAVFQRLAGVHAVSSGYAGGSVDNPSYKQVCGGGSGHAEVIKVDFDPALADYRQVLNLFWQAHDPTTLNRQGADSGTQYRSIILADDDAQLALAQQSKAAAQKHFAAPIVTEIALLKKFWVAEREHHDFYNRNQAHPYCLFNIVPKLKKLNM